ncbi:MAG: hypothetical protein IKO49_01580 [Bacilli bacterium]|nr:hypothetical protein [Clostridia bacterium]MBR4617991.1 hypothetical protein [Bacilli bacterium]
MKNCAILYINKLDYDKLDMDAEDVNVFVSKNILPMLFTCINSDIIAINTGLHTYNLKYNRKKKRYILTKYTDKQQYFSDISYKFITNMTKSDIKALQGLQRILHTENFCLLDYVKIKLQQWND